MEVEVSELIMVVEVEELNVLRRCVEERGWGGGGRQLAI